MVHVVNKGKSGEREAVNFLQPLVNAVYEQYKMDPPKLLRNQMQSAVGGYDIVGLDWLALEIKRQETLSINAWWKQVTKAALLHQTPLLMFRQNNKKWRFILPVWGHTGGSGHVEMRGEISLEDFHKWFNDRLHYHAKQESEILELN